MKKIIIFCLLSCNIWLTSAINIKPNYALPIENDTIKYSKILNALHNWKIADASIELKSIAISSNPNDEAYFYFFKGVVTYYSWRQSDSANGNTSLVFIDSAIKYFEKSISINSSISFSKLYINSPKDGLDTCATVLSSNAKMNYLKGDYLKSTKLYEKAVDINGDYNNLIGAGLSSMMLTSYFKAEKYFKMAKEYYPKNEKTWIFLTEVYKRMGDTVNALNVSHESLLKFNNNVNILLNYYNVANWSNIQKEIDQSITKLEDKSVQRNDQLNKILVNYYSKNNDFKKAEPYIIEVSNNIKSTNERTEALLVFYYNWYINLLDEICIHYSTGNSLIRNNQYLLANFVLLKSKPYLANDNAKMKQICDFLIHEMDN
jgi:tetratricopeptide (TPR) repeat protein